MMGWLNLAYHIVWILGLALMLTTFSLAHWLAGQRRQSVGPVLAEPGFRLAIASSFALFGLGLGLLVEPWWYKICWFGIVAASIWLGQSAWRTRTGQPNRD
jgi:hypothetical protein